MLRLLARVQEPVVVFTEYRDTLTRLERAIAASGRSVVTLHGAMTSIERSRIPALFRRARTLVATDAAAEGLNLHESSRIVIHYELPWNPARLEQRIGRVDRIGQTGRVHDIALVMSDSAEGLVLAPLRRRGSRAVCGTSALSAPHKADLLHKLTESAVAEAILSGTGLPDPDTMATPVEECELLDLRSEAREELARLEHHRILAARSPGGYMERARNAGPVVSRLTCRRGTVGTGLILLYIVASETADGVRVHAEPLALFVSGASADTSTPKALRLHIEPFVDTAAPPTASTLGDACARTRTAVLGLSQAHHEKLQSRRRAVASVRQSAAQQLVQQGLFERVHSRRTGERFLEARPDSSEQGVDDQPSIETAITLAAAIELRSRRAPR